MRASVIVALLAIILVAHAEQQVQHADAHEQEAASIEAEAQRLIGLIHMHSVHPVITVDTSKLDAIHAMRSKIQAVRSKVQSFDNRFQSVGDRLVAFRDRLQATLAKLDAAHAEQVARSAAWDAAQRTAATRPAQHDVTVVVKQAAPKFRFAMPRHADALSYHELAESTADVETAGYAADVRLKAAAHERDVTRAAIQAEAELRQLQAQAALQQTAALTQFQQQALASQARLEKTAAHSIERVEEALQVKKNNEKLSGVINAQIAALKPTRVIVQNRGIDIDAVKTQQEITDQLRTALKQARTVAKVEQAKAIQDAVTIQSLALRKQAAMTKKLEAMLKTANKVKAAEVAQARAEQSIVTKALRRELEAAARATKPVPVWVRELTLTKDLTRTKNVPKNIKKLMAEAKLTVAERLNRKIKAERKAAHKRIQKVKKFAAKKAQFLEMESEAELESESEAEAEAEEDSEEEDE